MAETWPVALQTLVNEEGFGLKMADTVLRSDMDIGPAKIRRRYTKGVETLTVSINLDTDQYDLFNDFFYTTLNGGAKTFNYTHPITQDSQEFRFVGSPDIRSLGGGNFRASMTWEILP